MKEYIEAEKCKKTLPWSHPTRYDISFFLGPEPTLIDSHRIEHSFHDKRLAGSICDNDIQTFTNPVARICLVRDWCTPCWVDP